MTKRKIITQSKFQKKLKGGCRKSIRNHPMSAAAVLHPPTPSPTALDGCKYFITSAPSQARRLLSEITGRRISLANNKRIGKGKFGSVYMGKMNCGDDIVDIAIKYIVIDRKFNELFLKNLCNEIDILEKLSGVEGVVQLYSWKELTNEEFHVDSYGNEITLFPGYYLYIEYCNGGRLFDYIYKGGLIPGMVLLPENTVRVIIKKLVEIMEECHKRDVVHRDLKPENILLNLKNLPDKKNLWIDCLRISDFGIGRLLTDEDHPLDDACGSRWTCSPEQLQGSPYTKKTDVWSIGVIAFVMLTGKFPFHPYRRGAQELDLERALKKHSTDTINFFNHIFVDDARRYSMKQLLATEWLSELDELSRKTYIED